MTTKPTNLSGKMPLRWGGEAARIAVIPGDGIGKEVTPEAVKVLRAVTAPAKRPLEFVEFDWGADRYLKDGISLPPGAVEMLRDEFDAVGWQAESARNLIGNRGRNWREFFWIAIAHFGDDNQFFRA